MASNHRAYKDLTTIAEFKEDLEAFPRYTTGYFPEDTIDYAFSALSMLEQEDEKKFVKFIHHVDKSLSMGGTANANRFHKIPTLLSGAIFFAYYPESIEDLDFDELAILAKYTICTTADKYPVYAQKFSKRLLRTVHDIGPDFMYRSEYIDYANHLIDEGSQADDVADYFRTEPLEKIKKEAMDYSYAQIQEAYKHL